MNLFERIWENRKLSVEMRLSTRMMLAGALASLAGTLVTILAHTHIVGTILTLVIAVGIPITYLVCVPRKKYRLLRYFIITMVLIIMPVLWLFAGGLISGMNIWIIFEVLFFAVSLNGSIERICVTLSIVFYVFDLYLWESGLVKYPLASQKDIYISVFGSVFVVATMVSFMTNFMKKLYKKEYLTVEKQNAELKNYADTIEKASNYQKIFLANMSHEIRSPMNAVLGFNRLALESNDIEEIHGYCRTIENSGESLLVIINDILDYSKIEAGKLELYYSDYSVSELVKLCKASISMQCENKGLDFICYADPSIPEFLYGDSVRIRQCVTNILTNAMKYTSNGYVRLILRNGGISEDGATVKLVISVADSGQGISAEQRDKLFTRFQRLNENTNRAIEGTGLGLSLTKSLMDLMDGTIDVESEIGIGSTFTLTLDQKIVTNTDSLKDDLPDNNQDPLSLEGMRVLVVDDTKTNLILMKKILSKYGIDADTAQSGGETLVKVTEEKYDLIFLDHMMPEMDGVETFMEMQCNDHLNKETPIIMLTANAMSGAMEEYISMGFDGYLSKPCNPDDIHRELLKYRK